MKNKYISLALVASLTLAIVSCRKKEETQTVETNSNGSSIESIIVTEAPAGAVSITETRKSVEVGKEITMKGKVMGRMEPFVDGRALVVLGDPAVITSCDLRPGDGCPTPWDVCCDDHDAVMAATATIQVLDAGGKVIKQGLKGVSGIKELSDLIVTGTIAEGSNEDNLLVNATGIYVKP